MKIVFVLVYFGEWPSWFPAFIQSCRHNRTVSWLIFTDCDTSGIQAENVTFVPFTMDDFGRLASDKLGFPVSHDNPYKLCDFKPAYGLIFEGYLAGYDFWGHCDLDVIWGDISKFITDDILNQYDVISARKEKMCGHFSLYRNTSPINKLFTLHQQHVEVLTQNETVSFDEDFMTLVVEQVVKQGYIKIYWPRYVLDDEFGPVLREFRSGWHWENGKLYNRNDDNREIMYIHFSEWKHSLGNIDFSCADEPDSFDVSFDGIQAASRE